jgi:hypothetical protein
MENACLACQCLGDFRRCDDGQIFAIGRCSFRPIVAAHDRDAVIDDQRLLVRDPGAGIDPYRHAGSDERANAFLEIAGRTTVADAGQDRVGHWIDERIDLAHIYAEIWKDVAPVHLVDVAVFCDSEDTHTGTAVELAGKQEYLCPALIHRPNHSAVQPFRLIGTCAGFRPKIPELVFDTTFLSRRRPTRDCLVGKRESAPIPAGCSDEQQAPLAGEADLRFGAAVEPSISDFSPSRPT